MAGQNNASPREALTFDDVLIKPGLSEVLPADVDIRSRITRVDRAQHPDHRLGHGHGDRGADGDRHGAGRRHRRHPPQSRAGAQAAQVRQVKKFESGMVVNPLTIEPDATLADALDLMKENHISGIPVVEGGGNGTSRQAGRHPDQPRRSLRHRSAARRVAELMTKDKLITVREGVSQDEAKRLLHQHRIEKLLVVDDQYRCVGLITVKDIEKAVANPNACKDEQGRLRVAAATTVGDKGFARTEALIDGRRRPGRGRYRARPFALVLDAVNRIKHLSNAVQVVAGNVATAEGAKALIDAAPTPSRSASARARSAPRASSPASACRSSPPSWMRSRRRRRPASR